MTTLGDLPLGKNRRLLAAAPTVAGTKSVSWQIQSESVLVSLWVTSVTGTLDVSVYTHAEDTTHRTKVISFPTVTGPTVSLLIRKAAAVMSQLTVEVSYSGACEFEVWGRGVTAAASSLRIAGATGFDTSSASVTTVPVLLVAAALEDRNGMMIKNNNATSEILSVAPTAAKVVTSDSWTIEPGGFISMDIAAGVEVWGVASSGTVDTRIVEVGGG